MPQSPTTPKASDRKSPITKIVTLSNQGAVLPIGMPGRELTVRPWRLKEERELADMRGKNPDSNMAIYVSNILSTMCSRLGSPAWDNASPEQRRVMVSQMWMGDVFYAYSWLRLQAMGADVKFNLACPACRNKFPFTADLGTLEVATVASIEDALWSYVLKDPFVIRGGKQVAGFLFGPPRWGALEALNPGKAVTSADAKLTLIKGSINDVMGEGLAGFMLTDAEMDEMSKRDLEAITALINDNNLGPDMSVEDSCPRCHHKFSFSIDWNADSFFGVSSR